MSEGNEKTTLDLDTGFLRSRRGIVKVAETVSLFVAFVCFAVASAPKYITATVLEFLVTSLLLLLYLLRLNKKLTFFFWPLVDVFNSVFAAVYLTVLSLTVLTSYTFTGSLVGGVVCLLMVGLLFVDGYMLFNNITFNMQRSQTQNQVN
ncbi:proteolipid protein 2 [Kryptolebias marmoratus]|uniref:Chemokine like factor n=1 Tax=Kryptolebias marmoratus TaxID=37003 RepID=A0A3Q2ZSQ3_KRYMA|nr:proteolipid protein 2 [Kryptolebias marmoratus]